MFQTINHVFLYVGVISLLIKTCTTELPPPSLVLYSPGNLEYTDVLVQRADDNLTLICELRGDTSLRVFVWNYVGENGKVSRPFTVEPLTGPSNHSRLERSKLEIGDSGHYMCSAPPFSVTKYILVQSHNSSRNISCARGSFLCENRCVLAGYVCDGYRDCLLGEDEAVSLCGPDPCAHKLNCSERCVSEAACCRSSDALCTQPSCCYEKQFPRRDEPHLDPLFPHTYDDRHAPDDYGFIQSTIYTVTACALIFMIAVVLLVSALCKMHMKRAALRDYHATVHHFARYPPRYEATRLLEPSALSSPVRQPLQSCVPESPQEPSGPESPELGSPDCPNSGFGLARLSAIFSSRYRQVPTQCCDVEMTDVRPSSLTNSPTRSRTLDNYRSPTYCDLSFFTDPDVSNCGRDLNYMGVDFFRRRAMRRNTLDRVMGHLTQAQRPLTLQLGRFQFSLPRFGRREEPRPDTPNVAEINIDDLDFVRLNSNETYTLNGRTIRLLGANFENYPVLSDSQRPPPYTEAMRYKVYGPPPEYLSREGLNRDVSSNNVDEEARNNVEMPPNYEDLASGVDANANVSNGNDDNNVNLIGNATSNATGNATSNGTGIVTSTASGIVTSNASGIATGNVTNNYSSNGNSNVTDNFSGNGNSNVTDNFSGNGNSNGNDVNSNIPESISSVIDNLPAIDSDVNANDTATRVNAVNEVIDNVRL